MHDVDLKGKNILPHDLEAEKSLLCCILMDENYRDNLNDIKIKSEYFYDPKNKVIHTAIKTLENKSSPIDVITLNNELSNTGNITTIGGPAYIFEVMNTVSTSANIFYYAEIVFEKYNLRQIILKCTNSIQEVYGNLPFTSIMNNLESFVYGVHENKSSSGEFVQFDACLVETIDRFSKTLNTETPKVSTGYKSLDRFITLDDPKYVVIAARPSMGKTQLLLNLVLNLAKAGHGGAIFSLEMSKNELTERILALESGVSYQKIQRKKMNEVEISRFYGCVENIVNLPIYINDGFDESLEDIRFKARKLKKDKDIKFLAIDHIGLATLDDDLQRHEAISNLSRGIKKLSKELEIPIFVLCQLGREVDKRMDKRPILSDLRDSGSIEQDADLVLFILRQDYYGIKDKNGSTDGGKATIIIGKNRNGATGDTALYFNKTTLAFEDVYYNSYEDETN